MKTVPRDEADDKQAEMALEHLLQIKLELWTPFLTTMPAGGLCWGLEQPPSEGVVGGGV